MSRDYVFKTRQREFEYALKNKAKVDSLKYYLGNDWIDWDCVTETSEGAEHYKTYVKSSPKYEASTNPPLRCSKCKKAFTPFKRSIFGRQKNPRKSIYLPPSVYTGVPLEKGDCGMCNG
tara:strand:- start:608 stop:964 length:357 start_codon:yes stop_codon:yes gene_type:complete